MITAPDAIYSTLVDDEGLLDLVALFVDEIPSRTAKIVEMAECRDLRELGRLAHQLRGAAGSYGFDEVTPYAARLEEAVRAGDSITLIDLAVADLIEICGRLRAGKLS